MQNSAAPIMDEKTLRWMPWVIAIAFFMQSLDGTILNTALPSMARSLAEDPLRMQSVVIAYMLTIALLIPASGWIADRFGIKRIFFSAILLFSFGSLLCALSNSLTMLVAARIIQGLGGALMVPIGRLIVLRAYPRSELVRIMGFITIPGLLGPLLGPTLGGWMVEYLSWHWIFLINIPVGLLGCYAVKHFIPDLPGGGRTHFDGIGFILFGAAMVLITIALEGLGELHLPHMRVVLLLFAGMGCLAAYWLRAGHIESPLFAPSLFRTRTFAVGIMGNLFARLGSGALPFLVPLLLQVALGYSPSQAGMSMLPLAAGMFAKTVARWLIEHLGYRVILTSNTLLLGILLASLALVDGQTPYWILLIHLGLLGAVNSLQFTAMNTVTLIDLDDASAASGNSLLSVLAQLSLSLGVASAAALLGGFSEEVTSGEVSSVLGAFQLTFLSVGVLAMFAAGIFLQLPPKEVKAAKA
ncbi:multidrug transporter subunit MdtD [Pseudomonas syringae group genomosp. 3]|uniref:multidrug transporter subunit MdtD n=1 Tax=Pseudomonas syringae group genomosp. 3 TaxID=251701 RepID=UPI0006E639BC|nr:multidrug transporter subunit MdtD [Pseudomonas syringae group genomosp. 3]KPW46207.1 Drug resistance transporter, EmrB/QacA family protein [Pseudomonas syringae pv. berberidis]KPY15556.1 Drug resistance transporter, EmrB/QacA family protein [Pseudomonas syringae pv. philadelphi]RMM26413.1 Drug resistance transporter, EmrB/QacA protein [Pseudomonas syringae pv. berberidis]RMP59401.1 Drug resistance transporter, EmrB/QacA protein [Pseudomonas syringae pv. berberidis]RMQ38316.1 Drug resistanc